MTNVTGWNELMNGTVVKASYLVFNSSFGGFFLFAFWLLINILVYIKQQDPLLPFVIGLILFSLFYNYLNPTSIYLMIIILAFEMAGVLYNIFKPD